MLSDATREKILAENLTRSGLQAAFVIATSPAMSRGMVIRYLKAQGVPESSAYTGVIALEKSGLVETYGLGYLRFKGESNQVPAQQPGDLTPVKNKSHPPRDQKNFAHAEREKLSHFNPADSPPRKIPHTESESLTPVKECDADLRGFGKNPPSSQPFDSSGRTDGYFSREDQDALRALTKNYLGGSITDSDLDRIFFKCGSVLYLAHTLIELGKAYKVKKPLRADSVFVDAILQPAKYNISKPTGEQARQAAFILDAQKKRNAEAKLLNSPQAKAVIQQAKENEEARRNEETWNYLTQELSGVSDEELRAWGKRRAEAMGGDYGPFSIPENINQWIAAARDWKQLKHAPIALKALQAFYRQRLQELSNAKV
ncbi:MAG: hypothetical protein L6Q71_07945 [Planctomycetes bacterium]|nr:hypothetical protein [Planctomycetota bacterium]NUQ33353.1 hypothetical protein [Planctomycetaceae bacterium]